MKYERETRKRLTNKICVSKKEKMNGRVVYSSTYLVQVKFDNGSIKNYSYTQFLNDFEIIKTQPQRIAKKETHKEFNRTYAQKVIRDYLNRQYPTYNIIFEAQKGAYKVYIGDSFCGWLQVSERSIKISYFIRMPNPLLAKYLCKWYGRGKFNLNYEFTDLNDLTYLYICLNELIFAHTQDVDKFVKETREPTHIASIK